MKPKIIICIDLARKPENPMGWTLWKSRTIKTRLIYTNNEMLEGIVCSKATIIAIDSHFSPPKRGILREADERMIITVYRFSRQACKRQENSYCVP